MKKASAIIFLLLLLLQAIPVGHFFAKEKAVFYAYVDEDKPEEGKVKGLKECKECLSGFLLTPLIAIKAGRYPHLTVCLLPSPLLDYRTPPPNAAC